MSTLIPSLGAARFDARGELRLAERLKDCLEDNAWVWELNGPGSSCFQQPEELKGAAELKCRIKGAVFEFVFLTASLWH